MAKTPPAAKAPAAPKPNNAIDRYFKITERGSTFGQEIRGGLVTFFAMSYIIVLNPLILGGLPSSQGTWIGGGTEAANYQGVAVVTSLVAGIMTILMGVVANYPLALAAGLGINAIVTYSLAQIPGASFADAMGIVVLEGIVILVLVLTGFRKAVFKAVPTQLKIAISVGIGLFIAFVGLIDARFATYGSTLQLGEGGTSLLHSWPVLVFVIGLVIAIVLTVRKVKGALLIAIVASTILAIIIEAVAKLGSSVTNPRGWALNVPSLVNEGWKPDFSVLGDFSIVGAFKHMGVLVAVLMVFSLLLADFFDTMGTMVAIGAEADLLDEEGNPPKTQQILIVDSIGAIAGGAGGVSSNTSYIESAAGVGEGARTGFASIITGICFLLSMFIAPVVKMVPYEAATPALVVVGFLMMMQVSGIDWRDYELAIPAFLTIILMPFTYSITVGIGAGFVSFVLIKLAKGKIKQVHPLMWITAILFLIYFAQGPINSWLS